MIKNKIKIAIIFYILLLFASNSFAAYTCTITANNAAFGSFAPFDYTSKTIGVSFSVTCSNPGSLSSTNVSGTITFAKGNSGSFTNRIMKLNNNSLSYNLYKDSAASTQILGDGTGGTSTYTLTGTLSIFNNNSITVSGTLYAKIPSQPTATVGNNYTDSIIITLTY